jgi:hypothetical protein
MKERFAGRLDVEISTLDSEEAKERAHEFKGGTNVLLDDEWVPLQVAIDEGKMADFLFQKLYPEGKM